MNNIRTEYKVEDYHETGLAFPIPIFDEKEKLYFQKAFGEFESIFENRPGNLQLKHLHLFYPWAYELVTHPEILNVIQQVLGPDIMVHSSSVFYKYPHDPSFVSWHQDGFYYDLNKSKLVSAWLALTDSTVENGCLRVLPGTHKQQYQHKEEKHENNMLPTGLTIGAAVDESEAINIELKAGEMSLHHVNIIHGSNPNPSDTKRIGFAIRYIVPEVKQKLNHFDVVLARGEDRYNHYSLLREPPKGTLKECQQKQAVFHAAYLKEREKFSKKTISDEA